MSRDRAEFIDWPHLLADLQYLLGDPIHEGSVARTPVGTPALAIWLSTHSEYLAGVKRTTVVGWLNGSELKFHQGRALLALWCEMTGKPSGFAPITFVSLSAAKAG